MAAAVPADSPCRVSASAGVLGMTQPTEATTNHSGTSSMARPPAPLSGTGQQHDRGGQPQRDGAAQHPAGAEPA